MKSMQRKILSYFFFFPFPLSTKGFVNILFSQNLWCTSFIYYQKLIAFLFAFFLVNKFIYELLWKAFTSVPGKTNVFDENSH